MEIKIVPILFFIVFIDIVGFGIILPLLPFIKVMYNISSQETSYLIAVFSGAALFGSIIWGVLSDKFGRKYMLTLPLLATVIVSILSAFATQYWQLFVLRGLAGFFMANFPVAFAAASDITTPQQRFKAMGLLGMAFSVGFVCGPLLGGLLATINFVDFSFDPSKIITDLKAPFFASAFFVFISFLTATFFYKESLSKEDRAQKNDSNIFKQFVNLYKDKIILFTTYLTIITSLVFAGFEVVMSLWLGEVYLLGVAQIGGYWTIFALSIAVSRLTGGFLFKNTKKAMLAGFLLVSIGCISFIVLQNYIILFLGTFLFAFGVGLIFTSINTRLSLQGLKNQQGTIFGVNQLFGNFGRIFGPILVAIFYESFGGYVWIFLGLICAINLLLIVKIVN